MWRIMSSASAKDSTRNVFVAIAMTNEPTTTPPIVAMPKLLFAPVNVIGSIRLSPIGAMKVNEASGAGSKSSRPTTPA